VTAILAAIGSLGTIAGLILYLLKRFRTTPEDAAQEIAVTLQQKEDKAKQSGRPE